MKKLDTVTGINSQAIANLTNVSKDKLVHTHEEFQNITKDLAWLHFTVQGQSALFTVVRQIEFSLLQLTQLDDLFDAVQCAIHGKLPIKLVKHTLQNILRNVTLHLPEGYELMVETRTENVHIYYELAKVSLVATAHSIKLIVSIPLKTTSHFDLCRIVVLPQRIASNTLGILLIICILQFNTVSAINCLRRMIIIIAREAVLPFAHITIFSAQFKTCEMSLYFQTSAAYCLCRRLIYNP